MAPFTVTGLAAGSATIVVSASGYPDNSVTVTVTIVPAIKLPANVTVAPGESVVFPIALTPAAPAGGVTVTLESADASKVTVTPTSVFVAAGATTPATQPQVSGVNFGSSTIVATASGYPSASQGIQVTSVAGFSPRNVTITGTATQNLTLNLSSPAPAGGLTMNLSSSNTSVATVPATVTFAAQSTSTTVSVKGVGVGVTTIHANAVPIIADTTAAVTVISAGTIGLPSTVTLGPGQSTDLKMTLPAPAPSDGVTVALSSTDPTKVAVSPAIVTIAAGQTSPTTPPQLTGVDFGSATINASAGGYTGASVSVHVGATLSFFPASLTITGIATQNLTLNLSSPAPASGLTINLSSSNTQVATVPATVAFPAKSTSATVPVTSVALGSATIHASDLPNIADTSEPVTVVSPGTILLPPNLTVGPGQSVPFPVTLSAPAPPSGVTVALASSDITKLTVTPASVSIAAGSVAPATQPRINGISLGTAAVSASAAGYATVSQAVVVGLAISFSPASLTITGTATQNLTLTLSAPAPAGGLTVTLSSSNPFVATVPLTVTFAANATSATVAVTGVAAGTATIHASALPNIADTTASVTVNPVASSGSIAISSPPVGQNLEAAISIALPQQAPSSGVQVTLTSSDQTKLLIALRQGDQGSGSLVVPISGGAMGATVYAQALAGSGTANLTASATGFINGSSTITMTPSGFVLMGPNGVGSSFSTTQGLSTTLTVIAARLDSTLNFAEAQQLRAGISASVAVTSSGTTVGTISPSPLAFNSGDQSATTQFTAVNSGSTTLTAVAPTGFSTPAQGANTAVVAVSPAGLVPVSVTVGKNLETNARIVLNGVASSTVQINLTSNNPSQLLLSTTPTGAGSASIVVTLPAGSDRTQDFYVYGLGGSGTATYTASAPGFGTATGTVTLAPSGFFVAGPNGPGSPGFFTTSGAAPTSITVMAAVLDSSLNLAAVQPVAGGTSVSVPVTSSNPSVGTIVTSPVTIAGGSFSAPTRFQPATAGNTTLAAGVPAGFSAPQNGSVVATVLTPGLGITDGISIGAGLQEAGTLLLGQVPSAGGVTVTLTSNNPSQLLLSTSATSKGSSSITVTIPAGSFAGSYFIQAFGSVGTVTYTASAPGYGSRTGTITLAPSGAVLFAPFKLPAYSTTVAAGPSPFTVSMTQLNPDNSIVNNGVEQVAGGTSVTVSLSTTNAAVGSIASSVTIPGGSDSAVTNFTPVSAGTTTMSVVRPAGFALPSTNTSVAITVH
jgi:hypothetical protein